MPFDPNFPTANTLARASQMREQLNSLKALIDAVPAGEQGPPGAKGERGVGIQSIQDTGGAVLITTEDNSSWGPFPLPAGAQGSQGPAGNDGAPGPQGPAGDPGGPPGPQGDRGSDGGQGPTGNDGRSVVNVRDNGDGRAIVDMSDGSSYGPFSVASGPQGNQGDRGSDGGQGPAGNDGVSVVEVFDSGDGRAIVRLSNGATYGPFTVAGGPQGPPGNDGAQGPQGPPGEVSSQQLSDAIGGTANNPSSIGPFNGTFSDPPTQAEMQAYAAWGESLRQALIR